MLINTFGVNDVVFHTNKNKPFNIKIWHNLKKELYEKLNFVLGDLPLLVWSICPPKIKMTYFELNRCFLIWVFEYIFWTAQ